MDADGTGRDAEGDVIGTALDQGDVGIVCDADPGAAELNFSAGVVAGDDAIAGTERQVGIGLTKGIAAGGLDGDIADEAGEASGLSRRIVLGPGGDAEADHKGEENDYGVSQREAGG